MSADAIADEIVAEALDGVDGTGVRIGLIGEIGVSADFTPDGGEERCAAPPAPSARTGLPLMVHLPGWFRHGARGARHRRGGGRRSRATPSSAT